MMFGAAAGVRANRHFGFFIVVDHARPNVQRVLRTFARVISAGIIPAKILGAVSTSLRFV